MSKEIWRLEMNSQVSGVFPEKFKKLIFEINTSDYCVDLKLSGKSTSARRRAERNIILSRKKITLAQ
jgi:hypothetical protein